MPESNRPERTMKTLLPESHPVRRRSTGGRHFGEYASGIMNNLRPTRSRRMTLTAAFWAAALLSTTNVNPLAAESTAKAAGVLFGETFDDARLTERGWYDGRTF